MSRTKYSRVASRSARLLEVVDLKTKRSPLKTSTIPRPRTPDQYLSLSLSSPARPTLQPWRTTLSRSARSLRIVSIRKSANHLQATLSPAQSLLQSLRGPLAFGSTLHSSVTCQNGNLAGRNWPERPSIAALGSAHHASPSCSAMTRES